MNGYRLLVGLQLAVVFIAFIMWLPHRTPRIKGIENDLGFNYIPMARELATKIAGGEPHELRTYSWQYHGAFYPLLLVLGRYLIGPNIDWGYFIWSKWYSAIAGGSILLLAVLWLGIPVGLFAACALALTPLFVEYSFSCGTMLISLALFLWAVYCLTEGRLSQRKCLVSGLLFALTVDVRHEYIIFLPVALIYFIWRYKPINRSLSSEVDETKADRKNFWTFFKRHLAFIILVTPFILIVIPDMSNWNGIYNFSLKYRGDGVRHDFWPEYAYTEYYTDDIAEPYMSYLINKAAERYPNILSVIMDEPLENAVILTRDFLRGIRDVLGVWVIPFLPIVLVLQLSRQWPLKIKMTTEVFFLFGIVIHLLVMTTVALRFDRYYLLEVVALTFAGSVALFKLLPDNKRLIFTIMIAGPFFYANCMKVHKTIEYNISIGGDRYLRYRDIFESLNINKQTIMLSRNPEVPFISGLEWHEFPRGLKDLHKYALDRGIEFIHWGSYEYYFREKWRDKLDNPEAAWPEYSVVDADPQTGILYHVNRIDSSQVN